MAFLFPRSKPKTTLDLVRTTRELLTRQSADGQPLPKVEEDVARNISQMKTALQGTPELVVSQDQVYQLVQVLLQEDLLFHLASNVHKLPFETRKDTQIIISLVLRFKNPGVGSQEPPAIHYIVEKRPELIIALCNGYNQRESAMPCGGILREALKHDVIAALILYDEADAHPEPLDVTRIDTTVVASGRGVFWKFFSWIDAGSFEVSADAFNTFREILTRHKEVAANFMLTNYDQFFTKYNKILIQSDSYVTKRQSIKLLGDILLDRANYSVMMSYANSGDNLKICMNLLLDGRRMINYEGFHVFKIFVANPKRSAAVQRILVNNKARLLKFLPTFLSDRATDDQFNDEKSFLIRQIELLPSNTAAPS